MEEGSLNTNLTVTVLPLTFTSLTLKPSPKSVALTLLASRSEGSVMPSGTVKVASNENLMASRAMVSWFAPG